MLEKVLACPCGVRDKDIDHQAEQRLRLSRGDRVMLLVAWDGRGRDDGILATQGESSRSSGRSPSSARPGRNAPDAGTYVHADGPMSRAPSPVMGRGKE